MAPQTHFKRNPKPSSARVLEFLEESLVSFKGKYGRVGKLILMSKEMKAVVDSRTRGKGFLKRVNIETTDKLRGQSTIYITERKEQIK